MSHPPWYCGGVKSVIQEIFQKHFEGYRKTRKLPLRVLKAAAAIARCRTAALGGHVQRCPEGHVERVWYNSCKHRACPVCAFLEIKKWVRRQIGRLLNCDYYHTIFTIPWELNGLWAYNRKRFTNLLFAAAWETLKELLADPKYLGALPGVLASFHSWAQTLWVHPHLHLLVTGGGMTPGGRWVGLKDEFLLPSRVVSAKFRGKFLAFLRQAVEKQKLTLPPDLSTQQCLNLFNKLGRSKWHVMILPPYRHGRGVVQYLAWYVRGGPVSNPRVTADGEDAIQLRYKDPTRTQTLYMKLTIPEFLSRLIRHIPEPGAHLNRAYGLFAPGQRAALNAARALLGQLPVTDEETLIWQVACAQAGPEHPELCPVCGRQLIRVALSLTGLSPPFMVNIHGEPCQKTA